MHVLTNIKQNTFTILLYPIFWECFGHMHSVINPINSKIIWIATDHCWLLIYFLVTKYKNAILYHQSFYLDTKISSFFNFHGWEHCRWIQIPKNAHQLWLQAFLLKKVCNYIWYNSVTQCGNVLFQQQKMAKNIARKRWSLLFKSSSVRFELVALYWENPREVTYVIHGKL